MFVISFIVLDYISFPPLWWNDVRNRWERLNKNTMKRSLKVKRVYRLFDTLLGEPFGRFYGSRSSALKNMRKFNERGESIILQRFKVFNHSVFRSTFYLYNPHFLQFERFVKSR